MLIVQYLRKYGMTQAGVNWIVAIFVASMKMYVCSQAQICM